MRLGVIYHSKSQLERIHQILDGHEKISIPWETDDLILAQMYVCTDPTNIILMESFVLNRKNENEICKAILHHCPVIIITSDLNKQAATIFDALNNGAADVIELSENLSDNSAILLKKIQTLGHLYNITGKEKHHTAQKTSFSITKNNQLKVPPLILIGASTGGPIAIGKILSQMPATMDGCFIIIQHLNEKFAQGLADWLSYQTPLNVQVIENGSKITKGSVLIAGKNQHLIFTEQQTLEYTTPQKNDLYAPSIDLFFNSIAKNWPVKSIALLLTGMGTDGAQGLKTLRDKGWYTLVENEDSCVIFGMPKAAIALNAANAILSAEEIADALLDYLKVQNNTKN